jgi:hypothetical protein
MSQQVVGNVIDRLLTDEDLRIRFIAEPVETMADLHARGFELTSEEIDLFIPDEHADVAVDRHPSRVARALIRRGIVRARPTRPFPRRHRSTRERSRRAGS